MTLDEIVPYLPYKVKMLTTINIEGNPVVEELTVRYLLDMIEHPIGERPILRPLSDLTKPCLDDGKIPIVELLKPEFNIDPKTLRVFGSTILTGTLILLSTDRLMLKYTQFQKLFEWHFWLGDQSRFENDITDINSLKS